MGIVIQRGGFSPSGWRHLKGRWQFGGLIRRDFKVIFEAGKIWRLSESWASKFSVNNESWINEVPTPLGVVCGLGEENSNYSHFCLIVQMSKWLVVQMYKKIRTTKCI